MGVNFAGLVDEKLKEKAAHFGLFVPVNIDWLPDEAVASVKESLGTYFFRLGKADQVVFFSIFSSCIVN